jgi:putative tricarboxylic transport membrane protein
MSEQRIRLERPSEFVVVALLMGVAVVLVWDTVGRAGPAVSQGPVPTAAVPLIAATVLGLCGVGIAVDLFRGGQGIPDEGRPGERSNWRGVLSVVAAVALCAAALEAVGWVIAGALLFYLCLYAFGSRRPLKDLVVSVVLAIGSFYAFYVGLGIPLPPGVLAGVL